MLPDAEPQAGPAPLTSLVLGLVLVAAGVVGLLQIAADPLLQEIDAGSADPGPAFFPRLMLVFLVAGGIGQCGIALARALRTRGGFRPDPGFAWRRLVVPFALVASTAVYAAALPRLGYLTASMLFALAWLPVIGRIDRSLPRSPIAAAALVAMEALAVVAALYAIFGIAIKVPLP